MKDLFLFIDGLNIYCNNGNRTRITKKDLKEAKKRGMKKADIKISAYTLLTSPEIQEKIFIDKMHD